jgi:hypothetical protein
LHWVHGFGIIRHVSEACRILGGKTELY